MNGTHAKSEVLKVKCWVTRCFSVNSQIPQSQSARCSALLTQDPEDWDLGFLVCAWDIHCQSTSASKYSAPVIKSKYPRRPLPVNCECVWAFLLDLNVLKRVNQREEMTENAKSEDEVERLTKELATVSGIA